mgnify:CR=1 FL=1
MVTGACDATAAAGGARDATHRRDNQYLCLEIVTIGHTS